MKAVNIAHNFINITKPRDRKIRYIRATNDVLKENPKIMGKHSNTGNLTVIMDKDECNVEGHKHLQIYWQGPNELTPTKDQQSSKNFNK